VRRGRLRPGHGDIDLFVGLSTVRHTVSIETIGGVFVDVRATAGVADPRPTRAAVETFERERRGPICWLVKLL